MLRYALVALLALLAPASGAFHGDSLGNTALFEHLRTTTADGLGLSSQLSRPVVRRENDGHHDEHHVVEIAHRDARRPVRSARAPWFNVLD